MATYVALIGLTVVNWDNVIAKFNFSRYQEAFVHFDFMTDLSDKALPLLDRKGSELNEMQIYQEQHWEEILGRHRYMTSASYKQIIERRIRSFSREYDDKHWLSKNWSTIQAHTALKKKYGDLGEGTDLN